MTSPRPRRAPACPGCNELLLGEIKGTLDMVRQDQQRHGAKLEALDGRLRSVENRSAVAGAVGGALMAVGINLAGLLLGKK